MTASIWVSVAVALATTDVTAATAPPASARPSASVDSAAPAAGTGTPIERDAAWRQLVPGVRSAALTAGGVEVFLVQFDLELFRADVFVGAGSPPRPSTAAELRAARQAIAVVNGGFFDERRAPLGLRVSGGKTVIPLRARVDWGVLVIRDRRAAIIHSRDFRPDPAITSAVQVGPRLIADGTALKLKPQSARRTAVALDEEGRLLTLVVVDRPVQAAALAGRLATFGFVSALMLDGGPSTQLSLDAGAAHIDTPGLYPVPDLLAIFSR